MYLCLFLVCGGLLFKQVCLLRSTHLEADPPYGVRSTLLVVDQLYIVRSMHLVVDLLYRFMSMCLVAAPLLSPMDKPEILWAYVSS